jgi:hypothetical protein
VSRSPSRHQFRNSSSVYRVFSCRWGPLGQFFHEISLQENTFSSKVRYFSKFRHHFWSFCKFSFGLLENSVLSGLSLRTFYCSLFLICFGKTIKQIVKMQNFTIFSSTLFSQLFFPASFYLFILLYTERLKPILFISGNIVEKRFKFNLHRIISISGNVENAETGNVKTNKFLLSQFLFRFR